MQQIRQEITKPVLREHFRDRNKTRILFTIQKLRAGANPEPPPITQPETNIHEVRTPSQKVFAQEQNKLFVQQVQ